MHMKRHLLDVILYANSHNDLLRKVLCQDYSFLICRVLETPSPLLETGGTLQGCPCETLFVKRKERMINPDSWHLQLTAIRAGTGSFQRHRKKYLLAIQLDTIEFFCHSLMTEEEILVSGSQSIGQSCHFTRNRLAIY